MNDEISGIKVVELGKGKFAIVECWRMVDMSLVAIKLFGVDSFQARDKELKILSTIGSDCHYTAQIADRHSDLHSRMCCIAMDAYLGGALNKHIQQCGRVGIYISVIQSYVSELLSALAHLERFKCIHRDIKSTNCVLDHTGRLKLCDFGSATILHGTTRAYTITGTAVIMAPEMAATSIGYDFSVDYWAVGVMLYELLSCRLPAFDRSPSPSHDALSSVESEIWPTADDAKIAQAAIALESTAASDPKSSSRPSTAANKRENETEDCPMKNTDSTRQIMQRCWFLDSVDPAFGASRKSITANKNAELSALLGNFSFTPKRTKDDNLNEHAVDLVRILLTVNPTRRYAQLLELHRSNSVAIAPSPTSWNDAVRLHPFFDGVDWAAVDNGLTPPANVDFDRRLGCMELLEEYNNGDDELTAAQQALFDGF